jgi:hypothetical protein
VPSVAPRKAKLFDRYGTWNVPATTVLNRPLRPRAEGEQDWQPKKAISMNSPNLSADCLRQSAEGFWGTQGRFHSGCQTIHHPGKLSGVNEQDLGQSNYYFASLTRFGHKQKN